jgi:hypothetical protein
MVSSVSPQRAHRRAAWALVASAVGVAALIVSVWLVGVEAASGVRESEARARAAQARRDEAVRTAQTQQLRAGCARSAARDFEALGTNRDLRNLAREAAHVRRLSGQVAVARRYAATASRAEFRMIRIRLRLPQREDAAAVTEFCRQLYPEPTSSP